MTITTVQNGGGYAYTQSYANSGKVDAGKGGFTESVNNITGNDEDEVLPNLPNDIPEKTDTVENPGGGVRQMRRLQLSEIQMHRI